MLTICMPHWQQNSFKQSMTYLTWGSELPLVFTFGPPGEWEVASLFASWQSGPESAGDDLTRVCALLCAGILAAVVQEQLQSLCRRGMSCARPNSSLWSWCWSVLEQLNAMMWYGFGRSYQMPLRTLSRSFRGGRQLHEFCFVRVLFVRIDQQIASAELLIEQTLILSYFP